MQKHLREYMDHNKHRVRITDEQPSADFNRFSAVEMEATTSPEDFGDKLRSCLQSIWKTEIERTQAVITDKSLSGETLSYHHDEKQSDQMAEYLNSLFSDIWQKRKPGEAGDFNEMAKDIAANIDEIKSFSVDQTKEWISSYYVNVTIKAINAGEWTADKFEVKSNRRDFVKYMTEMKQIPKVVTNRIWNVLKPRKASFASDDEDELKEDTPEAIQCAKFKDWNLHEDSLTFPTYIAKAV